MRLTQLGHQVPRRNSTATGADFNNDFKETAWGKLAASNLKFGAASPTSNVELWVTMMRL
jgi:hypothetical protein